MTQQKIASVLAALDDKIELNNKINAELEAIAKTLYDYWFVQFDFPDANGKPYLPDYPYEISLTHSYDYAGVMLSTKGYCGIDLEIVKDKVMRIKEKFLKPEELAFITGEEEVNQLYACWCAKEAVYKLQGNKGVSFLHNITIDPFVYTPQGVMTAHLEKEGESSRFQVYYERFNEYMLGYVVA